MLEVAIVAQANDATYGRIDGDLAVREVRRCDHDGVDVRIGTKRRGIGRYLRNAPFRLALLQQRRVGAAGGDEHGTFVEPNAGHVVVIAHGSGADDADTNGRVLGCARHNSLLRFRLGYSRPVVAETPPTSGFHRGIEPSEYSFPEGFTRPDTKRAKRLCDVATALV